ncbi:hypothetical protein ACFT5B_04045 [Luteimicrobium sp. NPDC057192]|uniref:hypothetical protein n=1 Tax=Luteimicrobium sp. NPDC057192 TaxID=3346042 RepID=UPI0036255F5C
MKSLGRTVDDPTSDHGRWPAYSDLLSQDATLHLAEWAALTEPDLGLRRAVVFELLRIRSPVTHADLLRRARLDDDEFLVSRSQEIALLRRIAVDPDTFDPGRVHELSRWFQERLVALGIPAINRVLATDGLTKRIRRWATDQVTLAELDDSP